MAKQPKYRSNLERKIAPTLAPTFQYEAERLPYTITYDYIPDWIDTARKEIIEAKGRFDTHERRKMKAVRQQYPDYSITMIFTNPKTPINKGSKTTYGDWCDKHGIFWKQA